ncbi:hypothetical protein N7451_000403 [Penicillium sp. IBT 35674x]|nr:hypothetical protein N7451_000403 [Penicillium sp. IBT 35674x]
MFDDLKGLLEIPIPAHLARIADAYLEVPKFELSESELSEFELSESEPSEFEPPKTEPSKIESSKSKLFILSTLWGSSRKRSRK